MQIIYQNEACEETSHSVSISGLMMPDDREISNQGHNCTVKRAEKFDNFHQKILALS